MGAVLTRQSAPGRELSLQSSRALSSLHFPLMLMRPAIAIFSSRPVKTGWVGRAGLVGFHKANRVNRRPGRARSPMTD